MDDQSDTTRSTTEITQAARLLIKNTKTNIGSAATAMATVANKEFGMSRVQAADLLRDVANAIDRSVLE